MNFMYKGGGPRFKVVIVGDSGIGKTSIIQRFCSNSFSADAQCTIGSQVVEKVVHTEMGNAILNFYDTAGQERYRSLIPLYLRGASGIIIGFDVTKETVESQINYWLSFIKNESDQRCFIICAGNKIDLNMSEKTKAEKFIAETTKLQCIFVSAKTGENMDILLDQIANGVISLERDKFNENIPVTILPAAEKDECAKVQKGSSRRWGCCRQ